MKVSFSANPFKDIAEERRTNMAFMAPGSGLRLYPLVPHMNRIALKDTTLPVGGGPDGNFPIYVPKGTMFDTAFYVLHRLETIWGPTAEVFNPDRWDTFKPGVWEFMPFGAGPRGYVNPLLSNSIYTQPWVCKLRPSLDDKTSPFSFDFNRPFQGVYCLAATHL